MSSLGALCLMEPLLNHLGPYKKSICRCTYIYIYVHTYIDTHTYLHVFLDPKPVFISVYRFLGLGLQAQIELLPRLDQKL